MTNLLKKLFSKKSSRTFDEIKNERKKLIGKKIHKIFNYLITITNQFGSIKDCTPFVNIENFSKDFLDEYLDEKFFSEEEFPKKINNLQKSQYTDIKFVNLPRSLKYTDRLSMNRGLENRVPFLDHHLAKFCFNLTNQDKIKNRITRYISKEALKKYKTKGFFDKQKKTITDPQSQWLRTSLKDFIFDTFSSQDFRNVGIFNQNNVDPTKPVVFTCGAGVTACVLGMAYSLISDKNAVIYDGSWSEYGEK